MSRTEKVSEQSLYIRIPPPPLPNRKKGKKGGLFHAYISGFGVRSLARSGDAMFLRRKLLIVGPRPEAKSLDTNQGTVCMYCRILLRLFMCRSQRIVGWGRDGCAVLSCPVGVGERRLTDTDTDTVPVVFTICAGRVAWSESPVLWDRNPPGTPHIRTVSGDANDQGWV